MNKIVRISVAIAISLAIFVLNLIGINYFAFAYNQTVDYVNNPKIVAFGAIDSVEYKKNGEGDFSKIASNQVLFANDIVKTGDNVDVSVYFSSGAIVRLNANTEIQIKYSNDDEGYDFNLNSGEAWINTLFASSEMSVYFENKEIRAIDSIIDVSFGKSGAIYSCVKGESVLLNGNNEYTFISQGDNVNGSWLDGDWAKANSKKDSQSRDVYAQSLKEKVQKTGANYNGGIRGFYSALTFNRNKLSESYLSTISTLIDDSAYYLSIDDRKSSDNAFVLALEQARKLDKSDLPAFQALLFDKFNKFKILALEDGNINLVREKIKELILVGPSSSLLTSDEKIHFIRTYLYDALDANTSKESVVLMNTYFGNLLKFIKSNKSNFAQYATDDSRIIYNAFLTHPEFYKKTYFDMKAELEKALVLVVEDASKRFVIEQKIVAEKLELLRKLKEFAVQDKISTADAFAVADFIKNDATVYINTLPDSHRTGFQSELDKYSDFIAFLNDKRYESSVYGVTVGDRFISYLNSQRDKNQLNSLKDSILGDNNVATDDQGSDDEVKSNVSKKLELYNIKVEEFGSVSGKYISINKAVLDNVPFSAKYDMDYNIMSDVVVDGDKKYLFDIKPEKLNIVVNMDSKNNLADLSNNSSSANDGNSQNSKLEEAAKSLIVNKLKEFNMNVLLSQVSIVSLTEKVFTVSDVEIDDKKQKIFINFTLRDPFAEAENVEIKTVDGVMPLGEDKKVLLQSVAPTVVEFYDKAFYDKVDKFVESATKK